MHQDDRLLRTLGEVARTGDPLLDPQWGALCHGSLSEAEEDELLVRHSSVPPETFEAFRPLGPAAEERLAARILEVLAHEKTRDAVATPPLRASAPLSHAGPSRRTRRIGLALRAAGTAAAVAAVLALSFHRTDDPLSSYTMTVAGAEQLVRSVTVPLSNVTRFGPNARVEILLRPATAVHDPVGVRAFLVQGGRPWAWSPPLEIAKGGAVRIAGDVAALFAGIPDGRWTLAIAVGRPDTLPNADAVTQGLSALEGADADANGASFRLLRHDILIDHGGDAPDP